MKRTKPAAGPRGRAKRYCISVDAASYVRIQRAADEMGMTMGALVDKATKDVKQCADQCADCTAERAF